MELLEKLLQPRDKKPVRVLTPELQRDGIEQLYMANLDADGRDALEVAFAAYREKERPGDDTMQGFRKFVFAFCLADENNTRMITGDSGEFESQMDTLAKNMPLTVIARCFDRACQINALTKSDVEELVKNLEATSVDDGNGSKQPQQDSADPNGSKGSKTRKKSPNTKP